MTKGFFSIRCTEKEHARIGEILTIFNDNYKICRKCKGTGFKNKREVPFDLKKVRTVNFKGIKIIEDYVKYRSVDNDLIKKIINLIMYKNKHCYECTGLGFIKKGKK